MIAVGFVSVPGIGNMFMGHFRKNETPSHFYSGTEWLIHLRNINLSDLIILNKRI